MNRYISIFSRAGFLPRLLLVCLLALSATTSMAYTKYYNLWVCGVRVTSANQKDIPVGSGKASYDPDNHILTLDGVKFSSSWSGDCAISNGNYGMNVAGDALRIDVVSDCTFDCADQGLHLNGGVTYITGSGKLIVKSGHEAAVWMADGSSLNLKDADVSFTSSSEAAIQGQSWWKSEVVNVYHSRLEAYSPTYTTDQISELNLVDSRFADVGSRLGSLFGFDATQGGSVTYAEAAYQGRVIIEPYEPAEPTVKKKGDVNDDNNVDVADIASIIDVMSGKVGDSSASADVNSDGNVDVADIAMVIDIMAGKTVEEPVVYNVPEGVQAVDMGEYNGILWANMNVGATEPWEAGLYFAWGETEGHTADTSDGRIFDWSCYKWITSGQSGGFWVNKYQVDDGLTDGCWYEFDWEKVDYRFVGDGKRELERADDAARANWGGKWRMPTLSEFAVLCDRTDNELITVNGVTGWRFTSKIQNADGTYNSIFLPAAGYRDGVLLKGNNSQGMYWSNTLYNDWTPSARPMYFYPFYPDDPSSYKMALSMRVSRFIGCTIRPVMFK